MLDCSSVALTLPDIKLLRTVWHQPTACISPLRNVTMPLTWVLFAKMAHFILGMRRGIDSVMAITLIVATHLVVANNITQYQLGVTRFGMMMLA